MRRTNTHRGIYTPEIPSAQHDITGVPTSIAAFIGRAVMGPVDEPLTIFNFGDFERFYGGRAANFPMSYAVYDFFMNGGSQAVICRVESAATPPASAQARVSDGTLAAANGGAWGNDLTISWDTKNITASVAAQYGQYGLEIGDLFNLTVTYQPPGLPATVEQFPVVTVKSGTNGIPPNRLDLVLSTQSNFVRVATDEKTGQAKLPSKPPEVDATTKAGTPVTAAGGTDGGALASVERGNAQPDLPGDRGARTGIYMLEYVDIFNLLCIPWDQPGTDVAVPVWQAAAAYCYSRRAMLIVDPPSAWTSHAQQGALDQIQPADIGISGEQERNAAVYFPKVKEVDPFMGGATRVFPACGIIAGVYASTDATRGVWTAPAGIDAAPAGIDSLEISLTDSQNGVLNPIGINCLRTFAAIGPIVWGARTLRGADLLSDDYKYVPVRRLALYIEESLYRGTRYAVFQPNDEMLWSQLRLSAYSFLADLARQGAFYNYFVQCDKTTTTPDDVAAGVCTIVIGIAPVQPAEFIVLKIQQVAGQAAS